MFEFFKTLLGRRAAAPPAEEAVPAVEYQQDDISIPEIPATPRSFPAAPAQAVHQNGRGVELSLQSILNNLPLELQTRVRQPEVGELTVTVPLEKILAQLSRGSVKISFGELRQAAPQVFTSANDRDRVLVPLPLSEIIARLNPALIARRRVQKQVEVPSDINGPFDARGKGLVLAAPAPPQAEPSPVPVSPIARQTTPTNPTTTAPARGNLDAQVVPAIPAPQPPGAPALTPARPSFQPNGNATAGHAPAHAPAQPAKAANGQSPLLVGLTALAENWPDAVRQEIVQLNLVDAKVALPTSMVEQALKQGRIAFTWKSLRAWITPSPLPTASAHDGQVLELPLKVVAQLFLTRQRETKKPQQAVEIDENIPNLFFSFPQTESAAATAAAQATAKPPDTNYYVWDDKSDTARINESEVKRGPSAGSTTQFARHATPNEIVSSAAALDGVVGALIALPDGLMVASRLPTELNGDTLAAFLPQIFGKVSQCTKELRMGDLNNLNFTVGNVPWKIFRVNAIFFAALGRAGEALPTALLTALAAELDRKPK